MLKSNFYKLKCCVGVFLLLGGILGGCSSEPPLDENINMNVESEEITNDDNQDISEENSDNELKDNEEKEQMETDGGGNLFDSESTNTKDSVIFEITVCEKTYLYCDEVIELDDFLDIILSTKGEVIIHIIDDDATLNAYRKLTDRLEELEISYESMD